MGTIYPSPALTGTAMMNRSWCAGTYEVAEDTCFPSSNSKPNEEDGHLDHDCPESRGGFYYLTYGT